MKNSSNQSMKSAAPLSPPMSEKSIAQPSTIEPAQENTNITNSHAINITPHAEGTIENNEAIETAIPIGGYIQKPGILPATISPAIEATKAIISPIPIGINDPIQDNITPIAPPSEHPEITTIIGSESQTPIRTIPTAKESKGDGEAIGDAIINDTIRQPIITSNN